MNETGERRVLISVKVSTLLLIFLAIVAVIIIAVVISNKKDDSTTSSQATVETHDSAKIQAGNSTESTNTSGGQRVIRAEVSSRSIEGHRISDEIEIEDEEIEEEPEIITTPIEEVTISKDMDLTVRTGLSKEDFITLISKVEQDTTNFFEENAGLIYDVCEEYQINEIFFCGLISAESGWTIASAHRNTHNYISLMSSGGLIKYASVESGMENAAKTLHENYLTEGGCFYYGSTLAGMKTKFCPASGTWVNLVYQRMEQILN